MSTKKCIYCDQGKKINERPVITIPDAATACAWQRSKFWASNQEGVRTDVCTVSGRISDMQLEPILGLIPRVEARPDGQYAVYSDSDGSDVFSINIDLANSFQQTGDERTRGIELCIKARIAGGWRGDILNPASWLPVRKPVDIKERYKRIAQSEWFTEAYENRPVGEVMEIKDDCDSKIGQPIDPTSKHGGNCGL